MPNQSQVNVQLEVDTITRINEVAQLQKRPSSEIIQDAIEDYLNAVSWFEAEIEQGRKDLREGRFVTQEEMEEKYRKLGVDVD